MKHIMRYVETCDNTEIYECTVCEHSIEIDLETNKPHPNPDGDLTATHVIVKETGIIELKFDVDAE